MQEPERHHFTGPEACLGVLRHGAQLLIDMVEQGGDKLRGGHGLLRAQQGFTLLSSVEEVHNQCKMASEYYWFVSDEHHRLLRPSSSLSISPTRAFSWRCSAHPGRWLLSLGHMVDRGIQIFYGAA